MTNSKGQRSYSKKLNTVKKLATLQVNHRVKKIIINTYGISMQKTALVHIYAEESLVA